MPANHDPDDAGTPRWVKVFGIIALVLAVLIAIVLVFGGEHGPSRHGLSNSISRP